MSITLGRGLKPPPATSDLLCLPVTSTQTHVWTHAECLSCDHVRLFLMATAASYLTVIVLCVRFIYLLRLRVVTCYGLWGEPSSVPADFGLDVGYTLCTFSSAVVARNDIKSLSYWFYHRVCDVVSVRDDRRHSRHRLGAVNKPVNWWVIKNLRVKCFITKQ